MKQRPEVKAFKNELSNYRYYQERVRSLNELIEYCYHMLGGVKSPPLEPVAKGLPDKEAEYRIREEISRHQKNLERVAEKISDIERILDKMPEDIREAAVRVYADRCRSDTVAAGMAMSQTALLYAVNKVIETALNTV